MANNLDFTDIKNAVELVNKKIEHGNFYRIESGLKALDMLKGGWFRGEFSVVGGRPGMGKKGFILSIISNLLYDDIPVSLFTAIDVMNDDFITYVVSCIKFQDWEYCKEHKAEILQFVDLSNIFDNNQIYFDKSGSFIPNNEGYLKISKIIVDKLKNY